MNAVTFYLSLFLELMEDSLKGFQNLIYDQDIFTHLKANFEFRTKS